MTKGRDTCLVLLQVTSLLSWSRCPAVMVVYVYLQDGIRLAVMMTEQWWLATEFAPRARGDRFISKFHNAKPLHRV